MEHHDHQGWQSPKHQYTFQQKQVTITKCNHDKANSIIKSTRHSLEPDMAMGWKPKLPSCPLPLSYFNAYNQKLIQHIPKDDRFKIVYLGKRYVNSVQVNQQHSYFWRYRQRYSLNIALVQQAIKKIGSQNVSLPQQVSQPLSQKQMIFDSSFQSGNLELAVKVKPNEYDLFLRSDTNTRGHTNWFYFKVKNQNFTGNLQLNICNMGKTKVLYNKGMKPYVLQANNKSETQVQQNDSTAWSQQKAFDVCFVERYCRYGFDKKTFQLQFKYNFKKPNTEVYFAYGIPYTYSQLQSFINQLTATKNGILKCQKLCESLGGLNLPLLTISSEDYFLQQNKQNSSKTINASMSLQKNSMLEQRKTSTIGTPKRVVLVTGRIHPGQSNSSYVLQSFIRQLLKDDQVTQKIRQRYIFYIIPMLNPDGVVAGNFRTSYSGKDLNRQFNRLDKYIYPQVFYLNEFAEDLKKRHKKNVQFYFDFHGHSSKKNLFCYGPEYDPSNVMFFKCRTFAKIIQEINPIFSYRRSIFQISQSKKTTGRAHMLWNLKIPMTFTFQISNGLYETKERRNVQLDKNSMFQAGKAIHKAFCKYIFLETRNFGIYDAKAKVDTGIRSKKAYSQKSIRQKSLKLERPPLIPKLNLEKSQDLSQKPQKQLEVLKAIKIPQFSRYVNQIKQQPILSNELEGRSDSEDSDEDLENEELNKLHDMVKARSLEVNQGNFIKKSYSFKIKQFRKEIRPRKVIFQEDELQQKESNKENIGNENIKIRNQSLNGIDSGRRLYRISEKVLVKRPPLPVPVVYEKVVLCQKKFTIDFSRLG